MFGADWKPAENVVVIWFEAWQYQNETAPIVALLHEIRTQLPWRARWLGEAGKLMAVGLRSALLSIEDLTKKVAFQASKIERAGKDWEEEHLATKLPSNQIRELLEAALDTLLTKTENVGESEGGPAPRIVILVDDLDRCTSRAAFKLLEDIKIYLNLKNCVFVLAMDEEVTTLNLAEHMPADGADKKAMARDYLEKICKDIWQLPILTDLAGLLSKYLPDKGVVPPVLPVVREYRCLPANPRKIKAFANVLLRYFDYLKHGAPLDNIGKRKRHAKLIVAMAYLYHFHRDIYRIIESNPRFYLELLRWSRGLPRENEYPCLMALEPASAPVPAKGAPAEEPELMPPFPDPIRGNVLRIQSLLVNIGEVKPNDIRKYLLDQP